MRRRWTTGDSGETAISDDNVLGDCEIREEIELLMNDADGSGGGNYTFIWRKDAGNDFGESAFACPVLAH